LFRKNTGQYLIKTPSGYENFEGVQKKIVNSLYTFEFNDGTHIKASGRHLFLTGRGFVKSENITLDDTITGKSITNIQSEFGTFEVYDPVGVHNHATYFSNGVVSHNTEFLGSSNTLISGYKLQTMHYKDAISKQMDMDIYELPIKDNDELGTTAHTYAICVDVAEGRNLDYSSFSIFDVSIIPYVQVAKYRSDTISPILYPTVIYNAAKFYNDAMVLVEINNNPQIAETLHTDLEYDNVIKTMTGNKKAQQMCAGFGRGVQLGVKMSPLVKRQGCAYLKTLVESDKLIINDFDTISELTTFVASKNSFEADEGANDDMVMTLVIFAWMANQKHFKDIVSHDIRKQLQLQHFSQVDEEVLPFGEIDNGLDVPFVVEDGDVWVSGNGDIYSDYFKDLARSL
jgi:hypothetical protein